MHNLREIRKKHGLSQRKLAKNAGVSFRALQMIERGSTDPRLSSLCRIADALGVDSFSTDIWELLAKESDSIETVSRRICNEGEESWKLWLFEFVDAFRRSPSTELIEAPPMPSVSEKVRCLMASTVETLCNELSMEPPWWCSGAGILSTPWFVAGIENLKATALVESPTHFRKRNIFVLANFLSRA